MNKPITNIKILSKKTSLAPGYSIAYNPNIKDLNPLLAECLCVSSNKRYICYTTADDSKILTDIKIFIKKQPIEEGYVVLRKTADLGESCFKKLCIGVKFTDSSLSKTCITDICFINLQKNEKFPQEYQSIPLSLGHFSICYKIEPRLLNLKSPLKINPSVPNRKKQHLMGLTLRPTLQSNKSQPVDYLSFLEVAILNSNKNNESTTDFDLSTTCNFASSMDRIHQLSYDFTLEKSILKTLTGK